MPDPFLYCKAIGVAALVSTMVVLAMLTVRRKTDTESLNTACAVAIGLGLTFGYYVLSLQLRWPPVSGLDRLLTIVVPLTLSIELIAGFQSVPRRIAWLLRLGLAFTIPRILLHGSVYLSDSDDWTRWQSLMMMAVCGALLAGLWILLSWLFRRSPGVSIPLSLCLTIQCAGMAVMMAGYIKGGAAAFPLASTLMATTTIAWLGVKRIFGTVKFDTAVILGVGVVGLFGVVFVGNAFGRISTGSALTMLLAPLLCWISEVPLLRNRSPWLVGSIRLGLVAIPLIVVLALAKRDFDRDMSPLVIVQSKNVTDVQTP